MDKGIPRIALDAEEDVLFVKEGLLTAALDLARIHTADADEGLRQTVEEVIASWIDKTFHLVHPSLLVNGLPYPPPQSSQEHETYDEALLQRVQALQNEVDEYVVHVTERRKTVPTEVERVTREMIAKREARDNVEKRRVDNELKLIHKQSAGQTSPTEAELALGKTLKVLNDRRDDVVKNFAETLKTLQDLKKSIPSNLSRLERTQTIISDIEAIAR